MTNKEIFSSLFKPSYERRDTARWLSYLETINDKILWYPSAADDLSHYLHLQRNGINGLYSKIPTIIHSDIILSSYFSEESINAQGFKVTINWRLPVVYNMFNFHEFNGRTPVIPPCVSPQRTSMSKSGLGRFLKSPSMDQIREEERRSGITLNEYKTAPQHKIVLFNFNISSPNNEMEICDQYVLYFFWDNIQFIERILKEENIPIDGIFSKRDWMNECEKLKFWKYLSNNKNINNLIFDDRIFEYMEKKGVDPIQVAYKGDILVALYQGFEYQWDFHVKVNNYRFSKI